MQRDEYAIELARDQLRERLVLRIERMRVDAALQQRRQAGVAGLQRDLALARGAAEQHGNAAELLRVGDVTDDLRVVTQAHQSDSPAMRNSGVSATPNFSLHDALDVRDELLHVGGGRGLDVDEEVRVFG